MQKMKRFRVLLPLCALLVMGTSPAPVEGSEEDWFPGTSSVLEKEEFPKGFVGKWAPSAATCADNVGVDAVRIYPIGLDTYESGGRVERITQSGQERTVVVQLSFEGEGGFWTANWNMYLSPDGRRLSIWVEGKESQKSLFVKCMNSSAR